MQIDKGELEVVEGSREHFDGKSSGNELECMDYIVDGKAISVDLYDQAIRQPLISKLELCADSRVLDIGCGTGLIISKIEEQCAKVVGIDISQNLISRYSGRAEVFVCAAHEMPFEEKTFDRIYMLSVAVHFPSFDYFKKIIDKCLSLLDDNGILVIADQILTFEEIQTRYLAINVHELVDYLGSKPYPYSIVAQNKMKRSFSRRSDIVIYKDSVIK